MKKAIVHIGTGKTGSTAIQSFLSNYPLRNMVYPNLGRENQNVLSVIYRSQENWNPVFKRFHGHLDQCEIARLQLRYLRHFQRTLLTGSPVLISAEALYQFNEESISAFRNELLKKGYDDVLIVVYVRDIPAHYMSKIQQELRHKTRFVHPDNYKFPIKNYIQHWEWFFPDRVNVRPFDRSRFINGDVVTDFIDVTNSFLGSHLIPPSSIRIKNESLSVEQMMVLQEFRLATGVEDKYQHNLRYDRLIQFVKNISIEKNLKMTKPVLRRDIAVKIIETHRSDICYLNEKYGLMFPDKPISELPAFEADIDVESISTIVESYDKDALNKLRNYILDDLLRRNINDGRYLDWLRTPYWRIRDHIKKGFTRKV